MALKKYRPLTPGRRFMVSLSNDELTKKRPEKGLTEILKKHSGRNSSGKITVRHRGNRHKRYYRIIDFKRNKENVPGIVHSIEYDPNRTANIALIHYVDGEKRYILAPVKLKIGMEVISGEITIIRPGNHCALKNIPEGTFVHNIELKLKKGGQIARSAGTAAKVLGFDESKRYVILNLPSGERRKVLAECKATIGEIGNKEQKLVKLGNAGRSRHLGIRPTVRGSVMNPNDHPHGGGEGKTGIGRKSPMTPWGKKALGVKTRKLHKASNQYIVSPRNRKRRG